VANQKHADGGPISGIELAEGLIATAMNDPYAACHKFKQALASAPGSSATFNLIANAYLAMGMKSDAEKMFKKSLDLDFENNTALLGLGYIKELAKEYEAALDYYFQITDRILYFPKAHARIGKCFFEMGMFEQSANAYEMVLISAPRDSKTRKQLVGLYRDKLQNPDKANIHAKLLEKYFRGEVTVLTGLPGSGQSLLLSLLVKYNFPVFYDAIEAPDPAYKFFRYGHSAVFKMAKDKSVLAGAEDKVVRVLPTQLHQLPPHFDYKFIVLERSGAEIQSFLQKGTLFGNKGAFDPKIELDLQKNEEALNKQLSGIPESAVLKVSFADLVDSPEKVLNQICLFLDQPPMEHYPQKAEIEELLTVLY
jgi:tetratricopeptide (TPR) repeat protein